MKFLGYSCRIFFEEGNNRAWKIMRKEYILRIILHVIEYNWNEENKNFFIIFDY